MRLVLLAALAFATPSFAQVTPIWSSAESEVIPFDANYGRTEHALLANGDALMVAAERSRPGIAATVHLTADGVATRGQFGHLPLNDGLLSPDQILATRGQRALVGMTERGGSRALVAMIDATGQVLWVRPRYGRQARFFADGDVLLLSGHELMRLDRNNGDVVWLRNLLELSAFAVEAETVLPQSVDGSVRFAIDYRERDALGNDRYPAPLLVSLDATSGATQWQRAREATTARVFQSCAPVELAGDLVYPWHELANGQTDVVVERRSGADGALLWATRVADVEYSDGPCGFVATSSLLALSTRDEFAQSTLVALNHAGAQQWRLTQPFFSASKLLAAADGAVLVAAGPRLLPGDVYGTLVERRRAVDGGADWSVPVYAADIEWRLVGGELRIAWSVGDGAGALNLQRHVAATGALVVAHQAIPDGVALRPADVEFIDGNPYAVMAGLGADLRGIRVRRLDPTNGAQVWSQTLQLAETPLRVLGPALVRGPAGRLFVSVRYYQLAGPTSELREALLAIDSVSGNPIWQLAHTANIGGGQLLGGSDGSAYTRAGECVNPPGCTQIAPTIRRYAGVDGQLLWERFVSANPLLLRGDDLIVHRTNAGNELVAMAGPAGADLWAQPLSASTALVAALAAANGDVHSVRQSTVSGRIKTDVDRRAAADGAPLWSVRPGLEDDVVRSPSFSLLADGDVLLAARLLGTEAGQQGVSRPLLARIDAVSGLVEWSQRPQLDFDGWLTVRPVSSASASRQWARSLRYLGEVDGYFDERFGLTTVALADGQIGPEHLYVNELDNPITSPGRGLVNVISVRADGSVDVENRAATPEGLTPPRLQRWPAVGTGSGDVVLRRLGDAGRIGALGPSAQIELELENGAGAAVNGVIVGFSSPDDGLKIRLVACQLTAGTGACPPALGSSLDQSADLGAGAALHLVYEIHDPGFEPRQARGGDGARGVFRADTPYAFGDSNLGNNQIVVFVATGGASNGFE